MTNEKTFTGDTDGIKINTDTGDGITVLRQSERAWCLTQNHPEKYDFSLDLIKQILSQTYETGTVQYWAFINEISLKTDEQGNHTPHSHLIIYFPNKQRGSWLHTRFPHAALLPCQAAMPSLRAYILKDPAGKWHETHPEKIGEKLPDSEANFYEWGKLPTGKRKSSAANSQQIVTSLAEGVSTGAIIAMNNDLWRNASALQQARSALLQERFSTTLRDVKVVCIEGATGTGKTYNVLQQHNYAVFSVDDYTHPFDGYATEDVIIFDEFRSQIPLGSMLRYLDRYPCKLPARYANGVACYTQIYIISNWELERQYANAAPKDLAAFLRRIHTRRVYTDYNVYTDYTKDKYGNWRDVEGNYLSAYVTPETPTAPTTNTTNIILTPTPPPNTVRELTPEESEALNDFAF